MVEHEFDAGALSVRYARDVIEAHVAGGTVSSPESTDTALTTDRGAFVTLEADGDLRGCIGRPYPEQSAVEAIRQAAPEAATADPRFPPVRPQELDTVTVEVSLLTTPEPLSIEDGDPLLSIDVGRDGLIVTGNDRTGLLLPQVPLEHGWTADVFLDQTCQKAGLAAGCWRDDDVTVERFTADVYAEKTPRGEITAVPLSASAMG